MKKMETKNKIVGLLALAIFALVIALAFANEVEALALEGNTSHVCGNAAGTSRVRVNTTGTDFRTFATGALNVTVWAFGGNLGEWYNVGTTQNSTYTASQPFDWNLTWNTNAVTPGRYILNWTFTNYSGVAAEQTRANFTMLNVEVDNVGPVFTFSSPADGSTNKGAFTVTIASNESLGSATLNIVSSTRTFVMTTSGSTATYAFTKGEVADGVYKLHVTGTDNTACATTLYSSESRTFTFSAEGSGVAGSAAAASLNQPGMKLTDESKKNIGIIALALVGLWLLLRKK